MSISKGTDYLMFFRQSSAAQENEADKENGLTRIIHDGFYCNRRYAATTSLAAG
jgi:hypothetical protein